MEKKGALLVATRKATLVAQIDAHRQ